MAGLREMERDFAGIADVLETGLPEVIADALEDETRKNLREEGYTQPDGQFLPWPKRWFDTHRTPAGGYYTHKPLDGGEEVEKTLEHTSQRRGGRVSTRWDFAQVHNEGGQTAGPWTQARYGIYNYPAPRVPARPFMKPGELTYARILEFLEHTFSRFFR